MLGKALWAALAVAVFLAGSCADGAEEPAGAAGTDGKPPNCGNGMFEPNMMEVCENVYVNGVATTDPAMPSCEQMGMGRTGMVTCDDKCMWNFDLCMDPGGGGMGGSASLAGAGGVGGGN